MNKHTVAKRLREIEQALAIGNETDEQRRERERLGIAISWFVAALRPDQLDDFENLFARLSPPGPPNRR